MKGLELSEKFYTEHGKPMLLSDFESVMDKLAVGLVGGGSECLGFDDEHSQDHDFEPGFCIFISDAVDEKTEFELKRAYSRLPREFMGFKRPVTEAVGGSRHGVFRISDFVMQKTGTPDGKLTLVDWLYIPEQSLLELTNGKLFFDGSGELTSIRKGLEYLPEDVRLKKLAGNLLLMGQSGQYNYPRCVKRGESAAAALAISEFVKSALNVIFLINKQYIPYYKWSFRALSKLSRLSSLYQPLESLLTEQNDNKQQQIESVCEMIITELRADTLTDFFGTEAEGHAYSVNNKITDHNIRNMHILAAI